MLAMINLEKLDKSIELLVEEDNLNINNKQIMNWYISRYRWEISIDLFLFGEIGSILFPHPEFISSLVEIQSTWRINFL